LASRTAGGLTTSFLYDGVEIALDRSEGSVVDYLSGPRIDEKLRQANASGALFFLQDHLGSTAALADSAGNVTERIQYDPFGNTEGSATSRYGYTGRERDALSGLMYYRARWYDPQQGRFIHEDPIGIAGGANLYSYVSNNPLSKIDPFGLYEIDVHYYLTYYLAKMNGCFTDGEIKEIAEGDQGADEDPRTSPGAFRAHENTTYHALHEGSHQPYLDNLWQEATQGHMPGQNVRQFGVYLHYLQDTFSHRGYTNPNIGHFTGRHSVDKTDSDVGKAMDMARSTWGALNDYAKQEKCGCQGQDNSTMWATVNRFARAYGGGVIGRNLSTMDEMPELLERKRRILGVPRR
jgi:RHS repeat-associated protein